MDKHPKPLVIGYKFAIGLLSLIACIVTFVHLGLQAWCFFSTFLLLLTACYFIISAAILSFSHRRALNQNPCPMLEGMLISAYILQCVTLLLYHDIAFPGTPLLIGVATYGLLPILIIIDQAIFNRKGTWRVAYPLYWLALPVAYVFWIILLGEFSLLAPSLYPLGFLNLAEVGIYGFLLWLILLSLVSLIIGYILFLIDFVISGHLAQRVVLPHIRVVELSDKDLKA